MPHLGTPEMLLGYRGHSHDGLLIRLPADSYASFSSGGQNGSVVIDLQEFQNIEVNDNGIAKVGAGVRLGDLALSIYNQSKRALPHGTCPGVGLGGHATRMYFSIICRRCPIFVRP